MIAPGVASVSPLLARYGGPAPRYTSYPTAVQFGTGVDAKLYQHWLAQLGPEPISLYVHVPLCARLCWYCGCNTRAVRRREAVTGFVQALLQEIRLLRAALPGRMSVGSVHFGGGTPNTLSPEDLAEVFSGIADAFDLRSSAVVAAELDPAILSRDWVVAACAHGLNRASLGVQDLSPHVQAAVNRRETFDVVQRAVGWLRDCGVQSVNLDLMYGLPRQRTEDVLRTLDQVLGLRPDRLALFGYAHVPWMKPHQKLIDEAELPGAAERLEQSERAGERLVAAGFLRVGLDHFALPDDPLAAAAVAGRLRRNFQGYTDEAYRTLIGLGPSSIGQLPHGYVQNLHGESDWRQAVASGRLPIGRGLALDADDRFRAEIIERIMCDLQVDLALVCARHDVALSELAEELRQIRAMAGDGVVQVTGSALKVTPSGRPFLRTVCAVFDRSRRPADRHSAAV